MTLTRPVQPMPPEVAQALDARGLRGAYDARPPYQRNDYLMWIGGAKRAGTRVKRLNQMLDELEDGAVYMKIRWGPGA